MTDLSSIQFPVVHLTKAKYTSIVPEADVIYIIDDSGGDETTMYFGTKKIAFVNSDGNSSFKHYTDLSQLGISTTTTCLSIATAMARTSKAMIDFDNGMVSDAPYQKGTLIIDRVDNNRAVALYYGDVPQSGSAPECFFKSMDPSNQTSSNWNEYVTTAKLTNHLNATSPGTALDAAQGSALKQSIGDLMKTLQYNVDSFSIASVGIGDVSLYLVPKTQDISVPAGYKIAAITISSSSPRVVCKITNYSNTSISYVAANQALGLAVTTSVTIDILCIKII